jgi:hypothetical protein
MKRRLPCRESKLRFLYQVDNLEFFAQYGEAYAITEEQRNWELGAVREQLLAPHNALTQQEIDLLLTPEDDFPIPTGYKPEAPKQAPCRQDTEVLSQVEIDQLLAAMDAGPEDDSEGWEDFMNFKLTNAEMSYPCKRSDEYGIIIEICSTDEGFIDNIQHPAYARVYDMNMNFIGKLVITAEKPENLSEIISKGENLSLVDKQKIYTWANNNNELGVNNWKYLINEWNRRRSD